MGLWGCDEWGYFGWNSIVLLVVVKCVRVMGVRLVGMGKGIILYVWLFCVLGVYWLCVRAILGVYYWGCVGCDWWE